MNINMTLQEVWALFREAHCKMQETFNPSEFARSRLKMDGYACY